MASKIRHIELLQKIYGEGAEYILNKLENENINIAGRSNHFVLQMGDMLLNYVDFIHSGDLSVLETKTISEIKKEYTDWCNLKPIQPEDEVLLIDYDGYSWVDLKKHRSSNMMFKMDNCGRVGVENGLIVLKEGELMHVVIVMSNDNFITQIKGVQNTKPIQFYNHILDFLIKYEPIVGFKGVYNSRNDFSLLDLSVEDREKLKSVKPHLFKLLI